MCHPRQDDDSSPFASTIDYRGCSVYPYQRIERFSQPSRGDQVVAPQSRHIYDAVKCAFSRRALEKFVPMIHWEIQTPVYRYREESVTLAFHPCPLVRRLIVLQTIAIIRHTLVRATVLHFILTVLLLVLR